MKYPFKVKDSTNALIGLSIGVSGLIFLGCKLGKLSNLSSGTIAILGGAAFGIGNAFTGFITFTEKQ